MAYNTFDQLPWGRIRPGALLQTSDGLYYMVVDERYCYRLCRDGWHIKMGTVLVTESIASGITAIYLNKKGRWLDADQLLQIICGEVSSPVGLDVEIIAPFRAMHSKKMTVSEIEEKLGHRVEIISEKEH